MATAAWAATIREGQTRRQRTETLVLHMRRRSVNSPQVGPGSPRRDMRVDEAGAHERIEFAPEPTACQ